MPLGKLPRSRPSSDAVFSVGETAFRSDSINNQPQAVLPRYFFLFPPPIRSSSSQTDDDHDFKRVDASTYEPIEEWLTTKQPAKSQPLPNCTDLFHPNAPMSGRLPPFPFIFPLCLPPSPVL